MNKNYKQSQLKPFQRGINTMDRILPKILATLTQAPRERVEVKWSPNSWTYNVFRAYEILFWRRSGIRLEQISDMHGNQYSFTLENQLATIEGAIRAYFKRGLGFRIVFVPQMQLAGFGQQFGLSPYRFAIAFDAVTDLQPTVPAGSSSGNHTVTGSNPILFGMGWGPITDVNGITAMTYNSVSMTFSDKIGTNNTVRWAYLYLLPGCATGTNSLAYTAVASDACDVVAVSYSGAAQTGQPDAHGSTVVSATTSINVAITVVASNCWIIAGGTNDIGAATFTGTNRNNLGNNTARPINDSNATVSTGSNTYTLSWTGSGSGTIVMASFAPAASGVILPFRSLLGVGI